MDRKQEIQDRDFTKEELEQYIENRRREAEEMRAVAEHEEDKIARLVFEAEAEALERKVEYLEDER